MFKFIWEKLTTNEFVEEGLRDELSLMLELELKHMKFIVQPRVDTRYDLLYNDVIALLKKEQRNGWRGTESETFAKKFVED
ncbi:hypothetical protein GLOIN_2v1773072 [Rhizophagus clarus]|uniref:Uncharacterized protein n=1 Tax=Rhizophagus clarus TaxID=94130 RepID=A0A8H3QMJ6_9GLOM|nr:hypothetical protein GLOIN_2v1773072 [Rhizophagus clarus]